MFPFVFIVMPNLFKSGTTATNGCIYDGNFIIGVDPSFAYGPTSSTSFYNGITPPTGGYTIYQNKAANGPSIRTAADDATMVSILQSMGSTGTTASGAFNWARQQSDIMVANIDYYGIVTSGLTFAVDSGYAPSYPQSGLTWYDLTKNGNDAILSAALTWNTATSGGTINFSSSNSTSVKTLTSTNLTATTYTYCAFVFLGQSGNPNMAIFGQSLAGSPGPGIWGSTVSGQFGFNSINVTPMSAYTNAWKYIVGVQDTTTQYLYVNGSLIASSAATVTAQGVLNFCWNGSRSWTTTRMGSFQMYNRPLSLAEITQNYNVLKTRFGL